MAYDTSTSYPTPIYSKRISTRPGRGVTEEEARRRLLPMNSISWNVGHLAWQEQRYFLTFAQNKVLLPNIQEEFRSGGPASTPSLAQMQEAWQTITRAADGWLDAVTIFLRSVKNTRSCTHNGTPRKLHLLLHSK